MRYIRRRYGEKRGKGADIKGHGAAWLPGFLLLETGCYGDVGTGGGVGASRWERRSLRDVGG